jgi:cytochrome c556
MMRNAPRIVLTTLLAISIASPLPAHDEAKGVVKERMDAMELMAKSMKSITQKLRSKRDLDSIKDEAKSLQGAAAKMPSLFPVGTNEHPSAAKATIWRNWTDFEIKAGELAAESGKLAGSETLDAKTLTRQVLRVSQTCSNCHESYRAKHQH